MIVIRRTPPLLEVGVNDNVYLSVSIENRNEDAYEAKLTITHPVFLEFVQLEEASSVSLIFRIKTHLFL